MNEEERQYNKQRHTNGDATIGYIEHRPSLHDEVGEIKVEKISHATEKDAVYRVAECPREQECDREAQ
jgi:hypothetical protein